ncbi:hypothetical protein NGM99_18020 [Mesorhizobium sp. RP14(2022)]|jgi:hypothetical protein|uniref:GlsB/YeaQ/YmgE family stress response membrane protein n=1 Tax=Mesorhizobium liriopis TaxID=2953882 RepID=A0ABT1CA41_9HYPH|nr:hypothetical protein [Mesorhizobium liriopis]MCO6051685.1 hypothetical protein [Mesorhizobium liriopis]
MIWNLAPFWLCMAVAIVMVIAFFFGTALDAIMGEDGFGAIGNMVLFTLGFFVAIIGANSYGIPLRDLTWAVGTGLGGAFALIATMALLKAGMARL